MTSSTDGGSGSKTYPWIWPVNTTVISGYNYSSSHHALDIGARKGSKVWSPTEGVIQFAGWNNEGYGNLIIIKAYNGDLIYLAHLSEIDAKKGQTVQPGQMVGLSGSTGNSSGPHLHFEIRKPGGSSWINPYDIFGKNPKPGTMVYPAGTGSQPSGPPGSSGSGSPGSSGSSGSSGNFPVSLSDPLGLQSWWASIDKAKWGVTLLGGIILLLGLYGLISGEAAHIMAGAKSEIGVG